MKETLYGRHAVEESLLANRRKIFNISIAAGAKLPAQAMLERLADERNIPLKVVPRNQLDRMAGDVNHQGIVAEASSYPYCEVEEFLTLGMRVRQTHTAIFGLFAGPAECGCFDAQCRGSGN